MKTIDELNNMHSEELQKLEDTIFKYYLKIKTVRRFVQTCEEEE